MQTKVGLQLHRLNLIEYWLLQTQALASEKVAVLIRQQRRSWRRVKPSEYKMFGLTRDAVYGAW